MLTQLRNSAQSWWIKILLGIIVITFVISFGVGSFTGGRQVLVEVGETEILVNDYLTEYQRELDRLRQRFPDNAEALARQLGLRNQTLERMVNRELLTQEAEARGLMVTEAEIAEAVRQQQAFHRDGSFSMEAYRAVLSRNGMAPADYESVLRDDLLVAKLQRGLTAGVVVNAPEVNQRYRMEHEQVEVDYVMVDPQQFEPARAPDEAALRSYYDEHGDEFTQPPQFKVHYFTVSLADLEEEAQLSDRVIRRYYERNLEEEFTQPKQVRVSHILKRIPSDASPEEERSAREAMRAVLAQARAGEDFTALAREHSEDFSKEQGGDLGYFARQDMVPALADAAFSMDEGEVSDLVRSPFGLHILTVTDIKPAVQQSFEEVQADIEERLTGERAEMKLQRELERLPQRIRQDGLEAVAQSMGRPVQTSAWFDSDEVLPNLGSMSALYERVSGRQPGAVGTWERNPVQGHVFYEVAERKEAFVRPFEEVAEQVREAVVAERRREAALEAARRVQGELGSMQELQAFAERRGLEVKTTAFTALDSSVEGIGANRDFQRTAFRLTAEAPFGLSIQDGRAYLLHFRRRFFPEEDRPEALKAQIRQRMQQELSGYVLQQEVQRLRSETEVQVISPEYLEQGAPGPARATAAQ